MSLKQRVIREAQDVTEIYPIVEKWRKEKRVLSFDKLWAIADAYETLCDEKDVCLAMVVWDHMVYGGLRDLEAECEYYRSILKEVPENPRGESWYSLIEIRPGHPQSRVKLA